MDTIRDVFHRYCASYESGDGAAVAAFLHPHHIYHPPGGAAAMSRTERIEDERFFFSAFSDIKMAIDLELAEADRLAARLIMQCTQTGTYQGIAA